MSHIFTVSAPRGAKSEGGSFPSLAGWLAAGSVALFLSFPSSAVADNHPPSFADLADELLPTVVNVSTTQRVEEGDEPGQFEDLFREFFERREGERPRSPRRGPSSLGSGFIVDSEGYIVTNNHVIAEADEITVRFHDDSTASAEVIGRDEQTDLALLKVNSDRDLPAASWGDSEASRIGDWVLAIGNPFGLGGSVTAGILSARSRDIQAGPYDDFLQTDAAINRGNSGGPMFNTDGDVIGVNTAIFSPTGGSIGIGFAIPSAIAENVIEQLREHGDVQRAWLGVRIQSVTDELAEGLRLDEPRGALVASVSEGGPAEEAGIRQGDVILEFDDQEVTDMRSLPRMVAGTRIGRAVEVVVWRRGEAQTIQVELGRLTEEQLARAEPQQVPQEEENGSRQQVESLGLSLAPLDDELRERYGLDERVEGVVVTDFSSNGNAAEKGIGEGDLIVEVDQEEVRTPQEVAEKVEQARSDGYRVVTLLIYSQGDYRWVAVNIG